MNRFLLFWGITLLCLNLSLRAQNENDALRFSQTDLIGSARSLGMGGTGIATGADLSAPLLNPAGLGLYRSSELAFSLFYHPTTSETQFLDASGGRTRSQFGVNNLGLALHFPVLTGYGKDRRAAERGIVSYSLSFGTQRLASYNRDIAVEGYNPSSSYTDAIAERANGVIPNNLDDFSFDAYNAFLIDNIANLDTRYFGAGVGGNLQQQIRRLESGAMNEFFAAGAINIEDKIYLGLTLSALTLRYEQLFRVREVDINGLHEFYENRTDAGFPLEFPTQEIDIRENFTATGAGVNAKLGVIIRPTDALRIGVNITTPTNLDLRDEYNYDLSHTYSLEDNLGQSFDTTVAFNGNLGQYEYDVRLPYRFGLGVMYRIGKLGIITGDAEIVDYASANLTADYPVSDPAYYDFFNENETIRDEFQTALNLRLGGEIRLEDFRLRAGGGYNGTPLSENLRTYTPFENPGDQLVADVDQQFFTLGVGYRQPSIFIDVAYVNQVQREKISPYFTDAPTLDPVLLTRFQRHSVTFTLGFIFR